MVSFADLHYVDLVVKDMKSGSDLISQAVSSQVPSAQLSLTSVFGMGTGGSSMPLPPEMVYIQHFCCDITNVFCTFTTAYSYIVFFVLIFKAKSFFNFLVIKPSTY